MVRLPIGMGIVLAVTLAACEREQISLSTDYFPTAQNTKWTYVNFFFQADSSFLWADTSWYSIEKDTLVGGKRYALLKDSKDFLKRGFRKEQGNYYYRDFQYFDPDKEYLFLKENVAVGSTWEEHVSNGWTKYRYTITGKSKERVINGKTYQDIIDVRVDVFSKEQGSFYLRYSTKHSYAKYAGEVYAYYPYPSFMTYSNQLIELVHFQSK